MDKKARNKLRAIGNQPLHGRLESQQCKCCNFGLSELGAFAALLFFFVHFGLHHLYAKNSDAQSASRFYVDASNEIIIKKLIKINKYRIKYENFIFYKRHLGRNRPIRDNREGSENYKRNCGNMGNIALFRHNIAS